MAAAPTRGRGALPSRASPRVRLGGASRPTRRRACSRVRETCQPTRMPVTMFVRERPPCLPPHVSHARASNHRKSREGWYTHSTLMQQPTHKSRDEGTRYPHSTLNPSHACGLREVCYPLRATPHPGSGKSHEYRAWAVHAMQERKITPACCHVSGVPCADAREVEGWCEEARRGRRVGGGLVATGGGLVVTGGGGPR